MGKRRVALFSCFAKASQHGAFYNLARMSGPASLAAAQRASQVQSRNSGVAKRLWQLLQDAGVSWEWKDNANWQSVATEQEELAAVITAWPLLSADLRVAILAIVHSADVAEEAFLAATE
jgi:hypothetical protein